MTAAKLIVILGPTGSGKSALALRLARMAGGEIVNYDSVQIYRGFDIGSAKPSTEERAIVPHHLFDIADADEAINAADYARTARAACEDISSRGHRPILVGGTFFWLRALLSGLPEMPGRDEELRRRIRAISSLPRGPARLHRWLSRVDAVSAARIAPGDRHRDERAPDLELEPRTWGRTAGDQGRSRARPRGAGPQTRRARREDVSGRARRRDAKAAGSLPAGCAPVRVDRVSRGGRRRSWRAQ
jgi:tRNA dimethylallyltransferase